MVGPQACPQCHKPLPTGAFMCPRCELVVDGAQVDKSPLPPKETSLVFALLAPADAKLDKAPGPPPPPPPEKPEPGLGADEDEPTVLFQAMPNRLGVPVVVGKLDGKHYTAFEAYVVSLVDGVSDVESLGKAAGLKLVEIQSVLHTLVAHGLVKMLPPPAVPASLRATAPGVGFALEDQAARRTEPFRQAAPAGMGQQASLQEAIALEKKGDFKGAMKVLARAIELAAQPAPLYNRLALVVIKERRDFVMAESLLQKAVKLDPKREVYLKNLAFAAKLARAKRPA